MWLFSGLTKRDLSLQFVSTTDLISSYFPKSYGEIALFFVEGTGSGKMITYFRVLGRVTVTVYGAEKLRGNIIQQFTIPLGLCLFLPDELSQIVMLLLALVWSPPTPEKQSYSLAANCSAFSTSQ